MKVGKKRGIGERERVSRGGAEGAGINEVGGIV